MKKTFLITLIVLIGTHLFATNPPDEGMWLPMFIKNYNYAEMQKLGLRLTPEQMYDINHSSLKDAIVQLGDGFCTGEIVSYDGLMFTNHHCGYQFVVDHSTVEHDYLKNGFWAMSKDEELPNPGFHVNFLERMEDVTTIVLSDVTDDMKESTRRETINKAIKTLQKDNSKDGRYNVVVKSFYEGNEYYMFVYTTYKDIRLVGAPPSAVGKFGGDTDNWMWPRHTGDFTVFRIYTAPDGSPAEYSKENIPLKPKHALPISLKGVKQGDYAMVWGYPGTTQRFMTSYEVNNTITINDPFFVEAFDMLLPIINDAMNSSDRIRLLYADDYASLSNTWKNMKGEVASLVALNVKGKKEKQEAALQAWIDSDPVRSEKYGNVLPQIKSVCENVDVIGLKQFYYLNAVIMSSKKLAMSWELDLGYKEDKTYSPEEIQEFLIEYDKFVQDMDMPTEAKVLAATLKLWENLPEEKRPSIFKVIAEKYKGNKDLFVKAMMEKSIFSSRANLEKFLNKPSVKAYNNDPSVLYRAALINTIMSCQGAYRESSTKLNVPRRKYLAAIKEMNAEKAMYPDANSTMRVTYGSVLDYYPKDGVHYLHYTTANGILEKEIPNDPEFDVPAKLRKLIEDKDFGQYGENGVLPVCFLTNNDITGGNSGSPVINADGELIGSAFDGNWEALSSDIVFNTELQRCINVDVRYVLFIIDKYAGAGYLLNEMDIRR